MRQLSIRLAVSLVAFFVGITFAWAFGPVFGRAVSRETVREIYVAPAVKVRACPTNSLSAEAPQPPPPPPAPPAVEAPRKRTRVVIRHADGTVQVTETRTGAGARE